MVGQTFTPYEWLWKKLEIPSSWDVIILYKTEVGLPEQKTGEGEHNMMNIHPLPWGVTPIGACSNVGHGLSFGADRAQCSGLRFGNVGMGDFCEFRFQNV